MSVISLSPRGDEPRKPRKESVASVYSSNSRLNLLNKRKRQPPAGEMSGASKGDRFVSQRVLSAKAHRVKQLQNQLADAHYHLQELSNENRLLRAMQKKQEVALQRYENSSSELPTVLNSHNEELRIEKAKYRQLKKQLQEVQTKLKERELQLQQLKDEHTHLLDLSRDRNLLEREKLQQQNLELTTKVQHQNDTISTLQRRLVLEAKNFKHQLQNEINKHKDTRYDLDMAINNADKLANIIEMKEKVLNNNACRVVKSPTKSSSVSGVNFGAAARTANRTRSNYDMTSNRGEDRPERSNIEHLQKLCENSRNLTSALSFNDESASRTDSRSRYNRNRSGNSSTHPTAKPRKNSSDSDDAMELAKTVQAGMADLSIFSEIEKDESHEEVQKKIEYMKQDLMNKIKSDQHEMKSTPKKNLSRRQSTESVQEEINEERPKSRGRRGSAIANNHIDEEDIPPERPKSRGRKGSVTFEASIEESTTTVTINDYRSGDEMAIAKPRSRASSGTERKIAGKPYDKYCKDIMQDIEKSSKVIDTHLKTFNQSKCKGDALIAQLAVVDKINEFVNENGEIPVETLEELNNNFQKMSSSVFSDIPVTRKRMITGRTKSDLNNGLDDGNLSNQDLLNDLLGRK